MSDGLDSVEYNFGLDDDMAPLSQIHNGRTVTIKPRRVTVWTGSPYYAPGELHVSVTGRVIRRDGKMGQTSRIVGYSDGTIRYGESMAAAPAWLRPYIAKARAWDVARRAVVL